VGPVNPNSVAAFVPILIMVIVAVGFEGFTLFASHFLGKRVNDPAKLSPYECGVTPGALEWD
jgi:NADH:ubiquinone oxidoreductase subunit 3 (subunit A)